MGVGLGVGVKADSRTEPYTDPATVTGTVTSGNQAGQGIGSCQEVSDGLLGEVDEEVHGEWTFRRSDCRLWKVSRGRIC